MRKCEICDLPQLLSFYRHVSEDTPGMPVYGKWIYGLHPTDELIREYVRSGGMYCLEEAGEIAAAVAVVRAQDEDYSDVSWQRELADTEVVTVHLLAVAPEYQNRGLAEKLMQEVMGLARDAGIKAIRLDAVASNEPAHRLYQRLGFIKVDIKNWYACNTGWADFFLFEYLL